jgi:hypothetical protein
LQREQRPHGRLHAEERGDRGDGAHCKDGLLTKVVVQKEAESHEEAGRALAASKRAAQAAAAVVRVPSAAAISPSKQPVPSSAVPRRKGWRGARGGAHAVGRGRVPNRGRCAVHGRRNGGGAAASAANAAAAAQSGARASTSWRRPRTRAPPEAGPIKRQQWCQSAESTKQQAALAAAAAAPSSATATAASATRDAIHQLLSIILKLRILVLLLVSTLPYVVISKNYS